MVGRIGIVPVSPHPRQHLLLYALFFFLSYTTPSGCKVIFHCDFVSISLVANDIEKLLVFFGPYYIFLGQISM
jgi:hypothetical protein